MVELTVDEVLTGGGMGETSEICVAEEFLLDKLYDGMLPSAQLISEAEAMGISKCT